jgi:hypothetical protein
MGGQVGGCVCLQSIRHHTAVAVVFSELGTGLEQSEQWMGRGSIDSRQLRLR